jgi:hypothetical protein
VKRAAAAAGLLLAVPFLAACSDYGPEAQEPPSLESLLATPSPRPTPPRASVVTGAVQAYIDGVNKAFKTGDVSDAMSASASACTCRTQLTNIAGVYAKHEHFVGTHIVVLHIVPTKVSATTGEARLTVRVPASAIASSNGKRRPLKAQPPHAVIATVVKEGNHWVVGALVGLPRPDISPTATPRPKPSASA